MTKKAIGQTDLKTFIKLMAWATYDHDTKEKYRKLGKRILQEIANRLGLKKGEYEIRWNPGGIAVAGDHILHTDRLYLAFHDNVGLGSFYFRACNGRKDYSGGRNHHYAWTMLTTLGLDRLIKLLQVVQNGFYTDPANGDQILNIELAIHLAESNLNNLSLSSA